MNLSTMKDKIESLSKNYHIEIARILKAHNVVFNENQNGIFVNLSAIDSSVIGQVMQYLEYIDLQESQLNVDEASKGGLKEHFFQN